MRHQAIVAYVALLVVLANCIEGREWLRSQEHSTVHEQESKVQQQQLLLQQQESVFWHRRVQQLDPGLLSRAERKSPPAAFSSVPAADGSGEPRPGLIELTAIHCMQLQLAPAGPLPPWQQSLVQSSSGHQQPLKHAVTGVIPSCSVKELLVLGHFTPTCTHHACSSRCSFQVKTVLCTVVTV